MKVMKQASAIILVFLAVCFVGRTPGMGAAWAYRSTNANDALGVKYEAVNNYAKAVYYYRLAAAQGDAKGENDLGYMYQTGHGVPQNYAQALYYYRLSAAQGNFHGEYDLGLAYVNGYGVARDYAIALRYLRLAAAQNYERAQSETGYMYLNGDGVTQDYATALHWYQLAAAQGYANAENQLGYMYGVGDGVPRNYATALHYYRLAAAQGNAFADDNLGFAYEHGYGVARNYATALRWYQLAFARGDASAKLDVQRVEGLRKESSPHSTLAIVQGQSTSTDPAYNIWLVDNDSAMISSADSSCWSTAMSAEATVVVSHNQWLLNGPSSALAGKVLRAIEADVSAWEPCVTNASTTFVRHLAAYHALRALVAGDIFIHGTNGVPLGDSKTCSGLQAVLSQTIDEDYIHNRLTILYGEEKCE